MVAPALLSSQTEEWATPQDLFDKLDACFHFTLDPCATDENHKAPKYFTRAQDGLKQDWGGEVIWCNPPYGREIGGWIKKCAEHRGVAVMLIPARTDTRWWHDFIDENPNASVHFIKGRLKFGGAKNPAPFPSAIVIFTNWRT
jgi:site-specific DNA-methyltransferase (adenine-specific)